MAYKVALSDKHKNCNIEQVNLSEKLQLLEKCFWCKLWDFMLLKNIAWTNKKMYLCLMPEHM